MCAFYQSPVDVFSKTQANPYVKHKLRLAAVSQLVS